MVLSVNKKNKADKNHFCFLHWSAKMVAVKINFVGQN
jgi:hypothetical protein